MRYAALLLCMLMFSCSDDPFVADKGWREPIYEKFSVSISSQLDIPVNVSIMTLEYRSFADDFGLNGVRFGSEDWARDCVDIDLNSEKKLTIEYMFGYFPPDENGYSMLSNDHVSSFLILVEFEDGTKKSYWGIPEKYDVNGYNATEYGIAYVDRNTNGLYTVFDESKRFSDFALKMTIGSDKEISFEVDYDNSTVFNGW